MSIRGEARLIRVKGIVQGVGFRPFVARLARDHGLTGWVRNGPHGVEIHAEGLEPVLDAFSRALPGSAPAAADVTRVDVLAVSPAGFTRFDIRESDAGGTPTTRIPPDLALCDDCVRELHDPTDRRFQYPYINCTNCGPRFSITRELPYDRARTTMAPWELCARCHEEYRDPGDRRFHAEPIACQACGPHYRLEKNGAEYARRGPAIARTAELLCSGALVAIKGIGGYHLACNAQNADGVAELRRRKYRKSQPFAVMARDLDTARRLIDIDAATERLLVSAARPIVLAIARVSLPHVAPGHRELGVMLPYAPLHHLLFEAGAPDVLVMTSANRSAEPIAFADEDALDRLDGIADAFLIGERAIARRVDDSVVRETSRGAAILRRGRGYAPGVVARLPTGRPILAVGADLKSAVTLVVDGEALVSQHIGDLEHFSAFEAFQTTIRDLTQMYEVDWDKLLVVHDLHPHYASTGHALNLPAGAHVPVQHHRAHVASVLAELGALETRVVGIAFDGTGYGDDGTIWGGEFFVGSVAEGLSRVASLQPFVLPGGDAAARCPVQAAAGVLLDITDIPDLTEPPFFSRRYSHARQLAQSGVRTFTSTSAGRLFDTAAALLGFAGEIEYEGQAAIWLEQLAWQTRPREPLRFALGDAHLDFRPAFRELIVRRLAGEDCTSLARDFHEGLADGIAATASRLCDQHEVDTVVVSGGTFQNALLLELLATRLGALRLWTNRHVPPNDGGISLGQAAFAAIAVSDEIAVEPCKPEPSSDRGDQTDAKLRTHSNR